ncbi:MAG TPA: ribonuclease E/G, partial [Candidatus Nitrosotenuis sp.]|nr:ribonuclease E/G [Candidatus Nitrosotenuis sp.]
IDSIELSSADAVPYVHQACTRYASWLLSTIQLKQPKLSTLLEDWGGEDQWQDTLSAYIEIGQEGSVIIQTTSVATTIDINAGDMDESDANFNLCQLLANQLIWRRLGGRVLIDFAGIQDSNRFKQQLVDHLKEELQGDIPRWHILGWSKSGLLELQRERRRCSLEQIVNYHEMSHMSQMR